MNRKLKKYADERLSTLQNEEGLAELKARRAELKKENNTKKKSRIGVLSALSVCSAAVILLCVFLINPPVSDGGNTADSVDSDGGVLCISTLQELNADLQNFVLEIDLSKSICTVEKTADKESGKTLYYTVRYSEDTLSMEFVVLIDRGCDYTFVHAPYDKKTYIGNYKVEYVEKYSVEDNITESSSQAEIVTDAEIIYITDKSVYFQENIFLDTVKTIVKPKPKQ